MNNRVELQKGFNILFDEFEQIAKLLLFSRQQVY
jgi:hypothetical protein